jgi:hypothetical protein
LAGSGGAGVGVLGFPGKSGHPGMAAGAAVFNESGTVSIVNSTFLNHRGEGGAGNTGSAGTFQLEGQKGSTGGGAFGAAVYNQAGTLSMTNCTLAANALVGGNGGTGGAGRTTAFGGDGGTGGNGGDALGAGVYTDGSGATWIVNCTFSDNRVIGGSGGLGGTGNGIGHDGSDGDQGNGAGAALYNGGGVVRLRNSILANSPFGANAGGGISDEGFNISSDTSPVLNASGSTNRVNPLLGPLAYSTGIAPVLTLRSNSPAIDAIRIPQGNSGPTFDQRNATRVEPYDIGAYEFEGIFSRPSLTAQFVDSQVLLSWPSVSGWILQSTATMSDPNGWTPVSNATNQTGSFWKLSLPAGGQGAFYRLRK